MSFFTTWCPACKAEIPGLVQLQNDYKNDFVVISILLEEMKTNDEVKTFIKESNINYDVVKYYPMPGRSFRGGLVFIY